MLPAHMATEHFKCASDTAESVCVLSHVWLCDPVDCSPRGSSVHGILQAKILE